MSNESVDARLAAIEARLALIEAALQPRSGVASASALASASASAPSPVPSPALAATPAPIPAAAPAAAPAVAPAAAATSADTTSAASSILGWAGALALVLAASYVIRLAIDAGWLTPARQLAAAASFGMVLIGAGFVGRSHDRRYAGLLPAAGVAILFMTIYGGHLYYQLIGSPLAFALIVSVCVASLWLCRAFQSDLYALLAVLGSYSAPFLLSTKTGALTDLALYFTAWSVVFSVFAVWHGRRAVYLLALYLALIGFHAVALTSKDAAWQAVLAFQAFQFAIFGVATAVFSMRNASPLTRGQALAHLPPLLLFYFLQYHVLNKHVPAYAPWIAVASLALVGFLYVAARSRLQRPLPGGELLLWCYAALVLFHAGFIESVPDGWAPWVALIVAPVTVFVARGADGIGARWPLWVAVGVYFFVNFLGALVDGHGANVMAREWLPLAYAVLLYAGYAFGRTPGPLGKIGGLLLYMGHFSAIAAAVRLVAEPIIESGVWAVLAMACLALAWQQKDKLLAQSSLAVFAATAAKVMLSDLSDAAPVARIVGLLVIGVTFYAGGVLYQWVARDAAKTSSPKTNPP
jgi:uncharacterized membrane protein